jgi:CRISPR/Cas system-associated endonuclease/helicase Cas3
MDRLESALEANLRTLRWLVGLAVTILLSTATIAAGIIW